jgi:hypothetical protein
MSERAEEKEVKEPWSHDLISSFVEVKRVVVLRIVPPRLKLSISKRKCACQESTSLFRTTFRGVALR